MRCYKGMNTIYKPQRYSQVLLVDAIDTQFHVKPLFNCITEYTEIHSILYTKTWYTQYIGFKSNVLSLITNNCTKGIQQGWIISLPFSAASLHQL